MISLLQIVLIGVSFSIIVIRAKVHYHIVKSDSWLPYQQPSSSWVDVDSMEHQPYDPSIHYAQIDVHLYGKHGKGGRIVLPISNEIMEEQNQLSLRQSDVEMNFLLEKITSMKTQIKQHKIIDMENAFLLEKVAQQNAKLQAAKFLHFGTESNTYMTTSSALSEVGEEDYNPATAALRIQIQTLQQSLTEAQEVQSQQAVTITKLEPQISTLQKQLEESEQDRQLIVLEERRLRLLLQDTMERTNSSSPSHGEGIEGEHPGQISSLDVEVLRTENEALKQRITAADALVLTHSIITLNRYS